MKREEAKKHRRGDTQDKQPHRVRLPGFIGDEDIGLGDAVKRATSAVGFRPCSGCHRRAEVLNRWLVFTRMRHN